MPDRVDSKLPAPIPSLHDRPPYGEDLKQWTKRLVENRVLSSYFGLKIEKIPHETNKFFDWVQETVGDLAQRAVRENNPNRDILHVEGSNVLPHTLAMYAEALKNYHFHEQQGNSSKADFWLAYSEGISELASDPTFNLGSDIRFIRDLLVRTDGFDQAKFTARLSHLTATATPSGAEKDTKTQALYEKLARAKKQPASE